MKGSFQSILFAVIIYLGIAYFIQPFLVNRSFEILVPQIYFFACSILFKMYYRLSLADLGLETKHIQRNILIGISCGLVLYSILGSVSFIETIFFHANTKEVSVHFGATYLFVLVAVAPIVEEIFFRGIFLKSLLERNSVFVSILFGSVIFMAVHGSLHLGAFLLGIVTSILYLKTHSVIPGILFHACANSTTIFMYSYWNNLLPWFHYFYK